MLLKNHNYVIGVDGGGTKTVAAISNLKGKILKMARSGSSNPRNVGIKMAVENIREAVRKTLPKNKKIKILSIFIGLPAVEEEFRLEIKEIQKELLKQRIISRVLRGKVVIGSDQLIAFRTGTEKKEGIVLIAGTGCVAHGWKGEKEYKASGWGWLADEGSAFWIGQKVFQAVLKSLDGRGPKTLLKDFLFLEFKTKQGNLNLLNQKIYSSNFTPLERRSFLTGFIEAVSSLSLVCDRAAKKGDRLAKQILIEAGKELAPSVKTVVKKLNFSNEKFPLVLVGSLLKSKIILDTLKKEIKTFASRAELIIPEKEPVAGAVRLAIEELTK